MKYILGFIAGIIFVLVIVQILPDIEERVYDCRMAEFHPDFPKEVREECRKLRQEQWRRNQITT